MFNLKLFFNGNKVPLILILLIPLILNIIWFREGDIMGVGESGLPFYNFNIAYESNKDAWNSYALGFPTNIGMAAKPSYWFMAQFQNIGVPNFLLQAFFLWLVFVASGFGAYFLCKEFFPEIKKKYILLAVLFYWFNPFALVNVWNRFLNNYFIFYALLPIALFLFLRGIIRRKYIFAIYIGLISAVFSYALTSIAFNILLWLVLLYTAIFYLFFKEQSRLFVIKFFVLSLLFFSLINFWWISQVFNYVKGSSFKEVSTSSFIDENNYQTFWILSERLGNLTDLFRLRHNSFFGQNKTIWIDSLNFPPLVFVSFLIFSLCLLPLILRFKNPKVLFCTLLFFIGIFLSKGNNAPFGEIFDKLFLDFFFLQFFRNPFEKFGFLLPLAGSPLFGLGVYILLTNLKKIWYRVGYIFVLIWLVIIWGFPFWTGLVFTSSEPPGNNQGVDFKVQVPKFYEDAVNFLNSKTEDFRLIVLPLGEEGITYLWDRGYSGVELSNQIFPVPAVSFNTNIPFFEDVAGNTEKAFLSHRDFTKLMNYLNSKYILLREDIDYKRRSMRDPKTIKKKLAEMENEKELKKVAEFGKLSFWENQNWENSKIFTSDKAVIISPASSVLDLEITDYPLITPSTEQSLTYRNIAGEIIRPTDKFTRGDNREPVFEIRQDIFPHVNILPSHPLYFFVRIKEVIEEKNIKDREVLFRYRLALLGKRLVETKLEADKKNSQGVTVAIDGYNKLLPKTLASYEVLSTLLGRSKKPDIQEEVYTIFERHLSVLEELQQVFTKNHLLAMLTKMKISPVFGYIEESGFPVKGRIVYQFDVQSLGEYELLWGKDLLKGYYQISSEDKIFLQVDGRTIKTKTTLNQDGYVSLGKFRFDPGIHEIGINSPEGINLVDAPTEINFKVDHGEQTDYFAIKNYDPYASYLVSFDYWIKKGTGIEVSIEENNSRVIDGKVLAKLISSIGPNFYDFTQKNFFSGFTGSTGADEVKIVFKVKPWNDCETIFYSRMRHRCKDANFRYHYDRTTEVVVNNIKVVRDLVDLPMLVKEKDFAESITKGPKIEYAKVDQTQYHLTIQDAETPFYLIFGESFDPEWKLYDLSGKEIGNIHFIANFYANGWFIEETGSYEVILKFIPQDLLNLGEKISLLTLAGGIFFVGFNLRKNENTY